MKNRKIGISSQNKAERMSLILAIIGIVVGLISPIIGYAFFALPSFLIARYSLEGSGTKRRNLLILSGISIAVGLLNANLAPIVKSLDNL